MDVKNLIMNFTIFFLINAIIHSSKITSKILYFCNQWTRKVILFTVFFFSRRQLYDLKLF